MTLSQRLLNVLCPLGSVLYIVSHFNGVTAQLYCSGMDGARTIWCINGMPELVQDHGLEAITKKACFYFEIDKISNIDLLN